MSFHHCCGGQHLRVGLPSQSYEPMYKYDAATRKISGFIVEVMDKLSVELGFSYTIIPFGTIHSLYQELLMPIAAGRQALT